MTSDANAFSAQPCGCDPGASWVCEYHRNQDSDGFCPCTEGTPCPEQIVPSASVVVPNRATTLPLDAAGRKEFPVATGVLDYFPDALVALARLSKRGNDQHNPGQPLHWDRSKSTDEADTLIRHFLQRGTLDSDGIRHSVKVAWRALALLQKEIEAEHG